MRRNIVHLILVLIACASIFILLGHLGGCHSLNPASWFHRTTAITESTAGEKATYDNLRWVMLVCLLPGIVMLIASKWIEPLKVPGGVCLTIGAGAAIMPWILNRIVGPALWIVLWCVVGLAVLWFARWIYEWVFEYLPRRRDLLRKWDAAPNPEERAKIEASLVTLERLYRRSIEKAFQRKETTTAQVIGALT